MESLFGLSLALQIILSFTVLCAGLLIPFIITRIHKSLLHRFILFHIISLITWTLSVLIILKHHSEVAMHWAFASAVILAVTKYYFVLTFPENNLPKSLKIHLPLLVGLPLFFLSFSQENLFENFTVIEGSYIIVSNGTCSLLYALGIMYLLIIPLLILVKKYKNKLYPLIVREQIKYLLYSLSFFFIVGLLFNSILPVFFEIYYFNGFGPALALVLLYAMYFIISRYRFLGLRIVLQRGLIFSTLLLLVIILYLATLMTLRTLFDFTDNHLDLMSSIITIAIAIFSVPSLEDYLKKITDNIFFKDTYDYSDALETLSYILENNIELKRIIFLIENNLEKIFRAKYVKIIISKENIEYLNQAIKIALLNKNKRVGFICVGEKLSGDIYTKKDLALLSTLTHQLNTAISRAKLHKRLDDYSKMLEKKIEKRTKDLSDAYKHQQYLTHEVSHNLQTYLTILKGELENFRFKKIPESNLTNIEKVTDNISSFIYDFLRLEQLKSQTNAIEMNSVNLSEIMKDVIEYSSLVATQKNIETDNFILESVYIKGNEKKIEELLQCVIGNSIKYMREKGNKKITITLKKTYNEAIIEIKDTGIGIPKKYIDNIFDRFYRCPNTKNHQGTGLGLPITKALVEKMNGSIKLSSKENEGTDCIIRFPLIKDGFD